MDARKRDGKWVLSLTNTDRRALQKGWEVLETILELAETNPPAKTREQLAEVVKRYTDNG